MKIDYSHIFEQTAASLREYYGLEVVGQTAGGADMFPENGAVTADGHTRYVIRFNPRVQTVLRLYNLAMSDGADIGQTVCHYALYHAFLELDAYDAARRHLEAFRSEVRRLRLDRRRRKSRKEADNRLLLQLYFIMMHESFHIVCRHSPETAAQCAATTRELLADIRAELSDQLSLVSNDELLAHPKTLRHLAALIPSTLPEEERKAMAAVMREQMGEHPFTPEYIGRLIGGSDEVLIEELGCDRQAWLHFAAMATADGQTAEDLLQFHLWFFTVFCAMDFNNSLLSQYRPALRQRYRYDGSRVVLRHHAFKTLLRQYHPDIYRQTGSRYLELHTGLEAIFRTAVLGLRNYRDDFLRLQLLYQASLAEPAIPDTRHIRSLEAEMESVAGGL